MSNEAVVNAVYPNKVNTKKGEVTLYSLYLQGVDGAIGSGFDGKVRQVCSALQKGDKVSYESKKNNKGYLEFAHLEKINTLGDSHAKSSGGSSGNGGGGGNSSPNIPVAVGHALNNSVLFHSKGNKKNFDREEVKQTAIEIYKLAFEMQEEAEKGLYDEEAEEAEEEEEMTRKQDAQDTDFEDAVPF